MKSLNGAYQGARHFFPDFDMKTEYLSFQIEAKGIIWLPLLSASNLNNHIIHSSVQHGGSKQRFGAKRLAGRRITAAQSRAAFISLPAVGQRRSGCFGASDEIQTQIQDSEATPNLQLAFPLQSFASLRRPCQSRSTTSAAFILATLPSSFTVLSALGSSAWNGTDVSGWCQGIIQMKDFPCKSSREDRCLIWPELKEDCHQATASAAPGL